MIFRLILGVAIGSSVIFYPFAKSVKANDSPSVYFSEINWAGSDRSTADEWFELTSNTKDLIKLDNWQVFIFLKGEEKYQISLNRLTIQPLGTILISRHGKSDKFANGESALDIEPDFINSFSLSNSELELKLYRQNSNGEREIVDVAGDGKKPFAGSTKPHSSMERINSDILGSIKSNWRSNTNQKNVDSDSTLLATPEPSGLPIIKTYAITPIFVNSSSVVSLLIEDPNGEDDIASVLLICDNQIIELVDSGLNGDQVAGDRNFSSQVIIDRQLSKQCIAHVKDQKNFVETKKIQLPVYENDALIILSEIVPDPIEGEEFIELQNLDEKDIWLDGWQIDDNLNGGSKPFKLDGLKILAHSFLIISKSDSKISLNDSGDDVNLIKPDKSIADQTHYNLATAGNSWSKFDADWRFVNNPSPNKANILDPPESITSIKVYEPPLISIAELKALKTNSSAQIEAKIISLPGIINRQTILVGDETGTAEIYLQSGNFRSLKRGEIIRTVGRRSSIKRARLIVNDGNLTSVVKEMPKVNPKSIQNIITTINDETEWVQDNVGIIRRNKRSLTAKINDSQIRITWPETIDDQIPKNIMSGSQISINGLLSIENNEPTITIQSFDDIVIISNPLLQPEISISTPAISPSTTLSSVNEFKNIEPTISNEKAVAKKEIRINRVEKVLSNQSKNQLTLPVELDFTLALAKLELLQSNLSEVITKNLTKVIKERREKSKNITTFGLIMISSTFIFIFGAKELNIARQLTQTIWLEDG